ncbi:hypothetical protein [Pseudoduganella lutea]|uniref:Uncharacterized protein n=1 Tax=Pseudoduganella lutea TaxID=321985 RepID=A0A4P6L7C3_9BURK|nr:hypothetical protein [Pseudoduganella lutea]QBE66822.1 hypothetical protein EWM63_30830 [Pseudoduganella lutea]
MSLRTGRVVRDGTPVELDLAPIKGKVGKGSKGDKRLLAVPWLPYDEALLERVVHSVGVLLNPP